MLVVVDVGESSEWWFASTDAWMNYGSPKSNSADFGALSSAQQAPHRLPGALYYVIDFREFSDFVQVAFKYLRGHSTLAVLQITKS